MQSVATKPATTRSEATKRLNVRECGCVRACGRVCRRRRSVRACVWASVSAATVCACLRAGECVGGDGESAATRSEAGA
jgi:hypothetical protein